jgi:hypothetical protein
MTNKILPKMVRHLGTWWPCAVSNYNIICSCESIKIGCHRPDLEHDANVHFWYDGYYTIDELYAYGALPSADEPAIQDN